MNSLSSFDGTVDSDLAEHRTNAATGNGELFNDHCDCCPYGFHIDTDFVRYCDALLTALYSNRHNGSLNRQSHTTNSIKVVASSNTTNRHFHQSHHHETYGTIERNFKIHLNKYLDNDPNTAIYHRFKSNPVNESDETSNNHSSNNGQLLSDEDYDDHQPPVNCSSSSSSSTSCTNSLESPIHKRSFALTQQPVQQSPLDMVVNQIKTNDDHQLFHHISSQVENSNFQTNDNVRMKSEDESPPPSPTASSSCLSQSTISKSVLTQIRNHLAQSLLRVKELENQVSEISHLKDEISRLETERTNLLEKLNSNENNNNNNNNGEECKSSLIINGNEHKDNDTGETFNSSLMDSCNDEKNNVEFTCKIEDGAGDGDLDLKSKQNHQILSVIKCDSFSVNDTIENVDERQHENEENKTFRSIGTLTNFAPCVLFRNVFVQTDLKSKDIKQTMVDAKENMTMTEENIEQMTQVAIPSSTLGHLDKGSQTENFIDGDNDNNDCDDHHSHHSNNSIHIGNHDDGNKIQDITKNDHNDNDNHCYDSSVTSSSSQAKLSIEDGEVDQLSASATTNKSSSSTSSASTRTTNTTDNSSTTPASSTQSIRLCEKCNNEMVISSSNHHYDYICSPDDHNAGPTISMPKIIKSDSGISVERRQLDNKIIEKSNNNLILVYPSIELFENIPLSDESESCSSSKDYFNKSHHHQHHGPNRKLSSSSLSSSSFVISSEIKAALKIINDNLFSHRKSFLFSKSVAVVKKNWFKISSSVDSDYRAVELYLDFIEKYSNKLLDFIVNLSDTNGNTAIHYAISYNNFDIVSILLDSKICDVNKYNKAGYTAAMLVSLAKIENELYRDIVERLFNQADVNLKAKQNGQTALMLAASHGRVEISKILLDCGAEVNLQDNDGSTALMCAAEHGHSEVISLLLSQSDCDPLIEDNEGSTALKIALVNGHNDIGVLLYAGARNRNTSPGTANHKRTGSFTHSSSFCSTLSSPYRQSPPRLRRSSISTSSPFKN